MLEVLFGRLKFGPRLSIVCTLLGMLYGVRLVIHLSLVCVWDVYVVCVG